MVYDSFHDGHMKYFSFFGVVVNVRQLLNSSNSDNQWVVIIDVPEKNLRMPSAWHIISVKK